ncbi:ATP-dependent helicase [Thermosipho ferrireducens]|uniref:ATP-dependent helicase n=1 Tax=Thermosipho ferrireducens TaxID=2571116 RepID=A0ABX7S7E3_9BACT|nr:UvrD-helicase domain-containing protein [Thermosipho ferrireducens]QTA38512.1 ATP-dependent helicase [Thermosipho ferrireducens]
MTNREIIIVSDEEIDNVEKILFPQGGYFGKEEKKIIKCFDRSIDIVAAPGSGKTTVLLAKLIILLNRIPLPDRKGICVLTHTNVAINEIKNKLGEKSKILFDYPNFFGTIQKFVDKFLAIPMYKYMFKKNLRAIDDMMYKKAIEKLFNSKEYKSLHVSLEKRFGSKWNEKIKALVKVKIKVKGDGNIELKIFKKRNPGKETPTYEQTKELLWKKLIKENGILKYELAYSFANAYIDKFPILKDYFLNRFKYVFIDEMQDTRKYQIDILNRIFDDTKVTIQRFGDPNQAIFNDEDDSGGIEWKVKEKPMYISSSKRFGKNIAFFVNNLKTKSGFEITGNDKIDSFKPHIIIFDDNSIDKVLDKFVDLIKTYDLESEGKIFKAIGWRKSTDNDKGLTIRSYYSEFEKSTYASMKSNKVVNLFDAIINSIMDFLKDNSNIFNDISKKNVIYFLEENYNDFYTQLRKNCINWYFRYKDTTENIVEEIYNFINRGLFKQLGILEVKNFREILKEHMKKLMSVKKNENKYTRDDIKVFIDTVHGVKGETHTATLYLETFFKKKTDIERILEYLFNNKKSSSSKDILEKTLRVVYVGISRPKKLLCIAVHKNTIENYKEKIDNCEIIEL